MIRQLSVLFMLLTLPFLSSGVKAQKVVLVDSDKVLQSLPEYQAAQKELDALADKWKEQIGAEYEQIKELYNKFQAEKVLLSSEEQKQRKDEILEREQKVRQVQKDRFGPDGELFQKRQELIKPIQEKIFAAIAEYADENRHELVLDKSNGITVLFADPDLDITEEIIKRIK